jgi:hypothetical protein
MAGLVHIATTVADRASTLLDATDIGVLGQVLRAPKATRSDQGFRSASRPLGDLVALGGLIHAHDENLKRA